MPENTGPDTPSLFDQRNIEGVALALAIHRGQRWVFDDYRDATAKGLAPCFAAENLIREARAVLEMMGEPIALTGMALATQGWVPFGTHCTENIEVEFHPDRDDGGMPMWERPVTKAAS